MIGSASAHPGMNLMMITADPRVAATLEAAGVDTIFVDMEIRGKADRQAGRDTVVSGHTAHDARMVRESIDRAALLVRVNPWWDDSKREIGDVLSARPDVVMLPFFKTPDEVRRFIDAVGGAAKTCLLFETAEAVERADEILEVPGIDLAFVGLNDLHVAYDKRFMFELVCDGTVQHLCRRFSERGLVYGFGGMARIGELSPPAERVLAEHYRLGSSMVILSRSFCDLRQAASLDEVFGAVASGVGEIRAVEEGLREMPPEFFRSQHETFKVEVDSLVSKMDAARRCQGVRDE